MIRLDDTQPSALARANSPRIPVAARRWRAGGCGRWLLLAIILTTTCTLLVTVALFLRALPGSGGASVNGMPVSLEQTGAPRAVSINLTGEERLFHTPLENPWDILQSAGIAVDDTDSIWINGALAKLEALPGWTVPARQIRIRRAARLTIVDDGEESTVVTRSETVGAALQAASIRLYPSDEATPALETTIAGDMTVHIKRALPIQLLVDGVLIDARTNMTRVGDALIELNAPLFGLDYARPPAETPVSKDMTIEIVRVLEDIVTESAAINFGHQTRLDDGLNLDAVAVLQDGARGLARDSLSSAPRKRRRGTARVDRNVSRRSAGRPDCRLRRPHCPADCQYAGRTAPLLASPVRLRHQLQSALEWRQQGHINGSDAGQRHRGRQAAHHSLLHRGVCAGLRPRRRARYRRRTPQHPLLD